MGGLLIAAAIVTVFISYTATTREPRQLYVVASHLVPAGTRLNDNDLRLVPLNLPDAGVRQQVFSSPAPLVGATVIAPLAAGALIEASAVVGRGGPPGTREVSISVDRSRAVAGTLKAGDLVIADAWGRVPTTTETARYWAALVAANVDRLIDRDNADFILPGQEFVVPPPPPPPPPRPAQQSTAPR